MTVAHNEPAPTLSWRMQDVERRFFFPGSKHTQANAFLSMLFGVLLSGGFYAATLAARPAWPHFFAVWVQRGWTQYAVCLFFFWGMALLFIKWQKLALQRRALLVQLGTDEPGFVLSPHSADQVLKTLHMQVDDPDAFILFNRVRRAMLSLRNIGRISDVETCNFSPIVLYSFSAPDSHRPGI